MAQTIFSHRCSTRPRPAAEDESRAHTGLHRDEVWRALEEQRTALLHSVNLSLTTEEVPEPASDPADQAAMECEQDLAIQVKSRTFDSLRRIEQALQRLRTAGYGLCRRCRKRIPSKRLKVQPDALFCVPCLTLAERYTTGQ